MKASAAPLSQPRHAAPAGKDPEHRSRYGPAWVLSGVALSFLVIQLGWLPAIAGIDVFSFSAEASISLIPLLGLFVVQHLRHTPRVYWPIFVGLSLLLLSHLADALDEVRVQPELIGILVEDGMAFLGYGLLVWGLVGWVRFNQRILREIRALKEDLEQRVAQRTAKLEAEMAKRQRAKERLRASEQRYRELNAVLEQRVEGRTAEVHAANTRLREQDESLHFILEGSRLGTWDWHLRSGEMKRNAYWAEMLGFTPQEVDDATATGWLDLIHPDDRERVSQAFDDHLAGRTLVHEVEYRMRTRQGGYRWMLDRGRVVSRDEAGRPLRMSGTHADVTHLRQAQHALEQMFLRFNTILDAMEAQIYLADMTTHEVLFMNQSAIKGFGQGEGQPCYRVMQGLEAPCPFCTNDRLVTAEGGPSGVHAWEAQNQVNQRWYDLRDCAVVWTDGRLVRMQVATDITERKHTELRLRHSEEELRQARDAAESVNQALQVANTELSRLATTDPLTGTWNRRHFEEAAVLEAERAQRYAVPLSLLLFDVDHFKAINDHYGHQVGDQVLVTLADAVQAHLRAMDLLARWGGEEFVILVPHCSAAEAVRVADKLRLLVAELPFPVVGQVTVSFGAGQLGPEETLDAWIKRVDDALYAAKDGGRNRVCLG